MRMTYGIIYQITCTQTKLSYIGQTISELRKRWTGHCNNAKTGCDWEICKAIRLYGPENFKLKILYECETSQELNEMERKFITDLNVMWPNGYNMRNGSQGIHESTRLKMREAKLGKKLSDEHKRKISESGKGRPSGMLGKKHLDETKQKMSSLATGIKKPTRTESHKQNLGASLKGKSAWNKGIPCEQQPRYGQRHSEETKQKMSKPRNDKTKQKMSAAQQEMVDKRHADIVLAAKSGTSFYEIVKQFGKSHRFVKRVLFRAVQRNALQSLPSDTYGIMTKA